MTSRPTPCPKTRPALPPSRPSSATPMRPPSRRNCCSGCAPSKATTRGCSRRRRAWRARAATWASPAPATIPARSKRCAHWASTSLPPPPPRVSHGRVAPPAEMARDLSAILARVEDEQDILDAARRWANDRRFQVGVQQLKRIVRPSEAGGSYSDIAQATISALCDRIEKKFADSHGGFRGQRLAVLGLGKLGSRQMSATSDLDLIFVYDIPPGLAASDGRQPLPPIQH